MLSIISKIFCPHEPRIGNVQSWVEMISEYKNALDDFGEKKYPFPWMVPGLLTLFEESAYIQFALFKQNNLNLTQTSLSKLEDPTLGRRNFRGMAEDYFILGMSAEGGGIVTGPKGAGKSEFVVQNVICPSLELDNIQVVHNMNIIDPREVWKPGKGQYPYCILDYSDIPKNAPFLDNCHYATSIEDALIMIITHALRGIRETGKPYLTLWVVDEAGISRSKQRTMSNKMMNQKHITLISRKLGCYQVTIYQLDDAPKEVKDFASHIFHKPSAINKTLVDSEIHTEAFRESSIISGLMDWTRLKKIGRPYIEYGTWDISNMDTDFDVQGLFDYMNTLGGYGSPVQTETQFMGALDFINKVKNRKLKDYGRDRFLIYLYRLYNFCNDEYDKLQSAGKLSKSEKMLKAKWRAIGSYSSCVIMASLEFPDEKWSEMKIKRQFDRVADQYPDALEREELPGDNYPMDMEPIPV